MPAQTSFHGPSRREFLTLVGTTVLGAALAPTARSAAAGSSAKPLRGIFPIAQTPFTETNQLDLDALTEEVRFIDRSGAHGFVWPQMASEWQSLTEQERLEGAEAIASVGKALRPAMVIGVQSPDVTKAVAFARHARTAGADAIISLPPSENCDRKTLLEYYQTIGRATELPLFVQAVGNMSVEAILEISKDVPTMGFVKDEAGNPLERIGPLREGSSDRIGVFSGSHGRTLLEEMRRGSSGSMPAASLADLYAATWDLWHAGKRREAMEMHARTLLVLTEMNNHGFVAMKYILYLRGIFRSYGMRQAGSVDFASAATTASAKKGSQPALDEAAQQSLREALEFVKPYLRT